MAPQLELGQLVGQGPRFCRLGLGIRKLLLQPGAGRAGQLPVGAGSAQQGMGPLRMAAHIGAPIVRSAVANSP